MFERFIYFKIFARNVGAVNVEKVVLSNDSSNIRGTSRLLPVCSRFHGGERLNEHAFS